MSSPQAKTTTTQTFKGSQDPASLRGRSFAHCDNSSIQLEIRNISSSSDFLKSEGPSGQDPTQSTQTKRFSELNLPQSDVFPKSFMENFDSGQTVRLSKNVEGTYDSNYNVVRFYVGQHPDANTVNVWLNEQGKVNIITDLREGPDAATLAEISAAGGIKPEALERLGITESEISDARASRLEREEHLATLESGSLDMLPNAYAYPGNVENTKTVLQGQGHFITPDGATNGLYTFGAGPCSVVVAVSKNANGEVVKVGMAHIDANTPKQSINSFLSQANSNGENLEVSVISGEQETALRIFDAVKQSRANLVFANIDRDGQRSDAVTVDNQGNIFYGQRMELANIDPQEMQMTAIKRQMPNQPLTFEQHN
jgi:hypothetical protein